MLALTKLRGEQNIDLVDAELDDLNKEKVHISLQKKLTLKDFWTRKSLRRPLLIAIVIKIGQHFSGINAVSYLKFRLFIINIFRKSNRYLNKTKKISFYSTKIFLNAGFKIESAKYASILLSAVQVIMTSICMLIIDKVGRRSLLVSGSIGMSFFAFMLAFSRIYAVQLIK